MDTIKGMTVLKSLEKRTTGQVPVLQHMTNMATSMQIQSMELKDVLHNIGHTMKQEGSSNMLFKLRYYRCLTCNGTFKSEADVKAHVQKHRVGKDVHKYDDATFKLVDEGNGKSSTQNKSSMKMKGLDTNENNDNPRAPKSQCKRPTVMVLQCNSKTSPVHGVPKLKLLSLLPKPTPQTSDRPQGANLSDAKLYIEPGESTEAVQQLYCCHICEDRFHDKNLLADHVKNRHKKLHAVTATRENHKKFTRVASAIELKEKRNEVPQTAAEMGDGRIDDATEYPSTSCSKPVSPPSEKGAASDCTVNYRCGICGTFLCHTKDHFNSLVAKHFQYEHKIALSLSNTQEDHHHGTQDVSKLGLVELRGKDSDTSNRQSTYTSFFLPEFDVLSEFLSRAHFSQSSGIDTIVQSQENNLPMARDFTGGQNAVPAASDSIANNISKNSDEGDIASITSESMTRKCGSKESNTTDTFESANDVSSLTTRATNHDTGVQGYVCSLCGTQFVSLGTCILHMKTVHNRTPNLPKSNKIIPCGNMQMARLITTDGFHRKMEKKGINENENVKDERCYVCSFCGSTFPSLKHCNRHMQKKHSKNNTRERRDQRRKSKKNGQNRGERDASLIITKGRNEQQHDREPTMDSLLKLTKCMLAVRYSDEEEEEEEEQWSEVHSDEEINESGLKSQANIFASPKVEAENEKQEDHLTDQREDLDEEMMLKFQCSVCSKEFSSIRDCGKHMICEHGMKNGGKDSKDALIHGMYTVPLHKLSAKKDIVSFSREVSLVECKEEGSRQRSTAKMDERKLEKQRVVKIERILSEVQQKRSDLQKNGESGPVPKHSKSLHQGKKQHSKRERRDEINEKTRQRRAKEKEKRRQEILERETPEEKHAREVKEVKRQLRQEKRRQSKMFYPCSECFEVFRGSKSLNVHISKKHCGVSNLKCQRCVPHSKGPDGKDKYRALTQEISAVKDLILEKGRSAKGVQQMKHYFECVICGESFGLKEHLHRHVAQHSELICPMCQQTFASQQPLFAHIHVHNCGPLVCEECGGTFYSTKALLAHLLGHAKRHQCDVCNASFRNAANLRRHTGSVHQERTQPFKCGECDQEFHSQKSYENHVKQMHTYGDSNEASLHRQKESLHVCETCGAQYKNPRELRVHAMTHKEIFICKQPGCGSWFVEQSQLALHQSRAHQKMNTTPQTSSNPWRRAQTFAECRFCGMSMRQGSTLIKHEKGHEGVAYRCDLCSTLSSSFKDHKKHWIKAHRPASMVKYRCDICGKQFATPLVMKHHRESHRTCLLCKKNFANVKALKSHLKVHRDPMYCCELCGKQCHTHRGLLLHQLRTHKRTASHQSEPLASTPSHASAGIEDTAALRPSVPSGSLSSDLYNSSSLSGETESFDEGQEALHILIGMSDFTNV